MINVAEGTGGGKLRWRPGRGGRRVGEAAAAGARAAAVAAGASRTAAGGAAGGAAAKSPPFLLPAEHFAAAVVFLLAGAAGGVVALDVRPVEPKDRFQRIMDAYEALRPGGVLELTVDHDPRCMYYTLKATRGDRAFGFEYLESGPETWRVRVTRCT